MRAVFGGMYSSELGEDPDKPGVALAVDRFAPEDPTAFRIEIGLFVGVVGDSGAFDHLVYFEVCSPEWLIQHPAEKGFRWGNGLLLLDRWDYPVLERALRDLCLHSEGPDVDSVLASVGRRGHPGY